MTGDPVRDAFRTEIAAIIAGAGLDASFPFEELTNTTTRPDAGGGFVTMDFFGGNEAQMTFGAPGANLWDERGQVFIRVVAPHGAGHDACEAAALAIRAAFRNRRFTTSESRQVRTNSGPADGAHDGARWVETVAVAYRVYNVA